MTKGGKLVIMHNFFKTNQKSVYSPVDCLLIAHAMFDVTCFPAFVGHYFKHSVDMSIVKVLEGRLY